MGVDRDFGGRRDGAGVFPTRVGVDRTRAFRSECSRGFPHARGGGPRDLFTDRDRGEYFAEHVVDGLLRGDVASRYQAYAIGRQWGWLSADDIRELENMNPLPDGSGRIYLTPMNMIPAGEASAGPPGGQASQRGVTRAWAVVPELRASSHSYIEARRRIARSYRRLIVEAAERILAGTARSMGIEIVG